VVVGPAGSGRAEILDALTGTDGSRADILTLQVGGTRAPFDEQALESGAHKYLHMDGRLVFTEAVRRMSASITTLLERLGKTVDDLALVIPHQANLRIIEAIRKRLDVGPEKVYVNVDRYGNTGSATVPIALSEAVEDGTITRGDLVVLVAFGAGFHWGGAALQF
jgi:3-oxoacyl-[acyl-carrier-protein] synthase-3